ncbi:MAG TPA: 4Fe-4S binding protein, partial [Gammaproteobacteria bacterium]|nr:4Fe-4S binding protein [Gammaproteobacteria bacterium]
ARRFVPLGSLTALGALLLCSLCLGPVSAQEPTQPPGWEFADDEEAAPTLLELAGEQGVDIGAFLAFAALAMVSFLRKSVPLKYVTLAVSVLYMGVYKSQLISVVNIFGTLTANLPVFSYSLAWYAFAIFSVVTTVLWGRLYCGRICAFGALTQLIDAVVPKRFQLEVPANVERYAGYVKYGILFAAVGYYLATSEIAFYRYIEPFWLFTFDATPVLWIMVGALLVASIFVRNLYCRFLCPLGAALGLVSSVTTVFKIKRWSECSQCALCEKTCEWGAIRNRKIIKAECVRCDDCEILYDDKRRCPHWLLELKRKAHAAVGGSSA